jgi:hypothetical protein
VPVAQLVEQGPFKPKVAGSSPARHTKVNTSTFVGVFILVFKLQMDNWANFKLMTKLQFSKQKTDP